jgi:hypothetical protein
MACKVTRRPGSLYILHLGAAYANRHRLRAQILVAGFQPGCAMPARFVVDPAPAESRNSYRSLNSYLGQNRAVEATILGRVQRVPVTGGESYYRLSLRLVSDVPPK